MGSFINEHGTKLYGGLTSFFGTLQALITTGSFDKLLSDAGVGWLGIVSALATAVLGGMTMARGFNNTAQVKVATVIDNALNAEPPKQAGFARLSMLAFVAVIAMTLLSACTTNPDGSQSLTPEGHVWTDEAGQRFIACRLPGGCFIEIPIRPVVAGQPAHPSWDWDGNESKPTLNPSVHTHGHWHGWFRGGRMVSC